MITIFTEVHTQPSRHPPFRVHTASESVDRACIPGLDPGRLPPPGTAAICDRNDNEPADTTIQGLRSKARGA